MIIQLRYAHQGDFIYIFEDAISDINIDYGVDGTMVCFDYNDKTLKANEDDFCFSIVINKKKPSYSTGSVCFWFLSKYF